MSRLREVLMAFPIVKMLRHHQAERCEAACEKQELLRRQHDIARRVHVIEWLSYPHTRPKQTHDD